MRQRTVAVAGLAVAGVLAVPGVAQAALLTDTTGKPCYGTGDRFGLVGTGFTPQARVALTRDGETIGRITAGPTDRQRAPGVFTGTVTVPTVTPPQTMFTYTATDQANPANTFALPVRVSPVIVKVRPARGNPARVRRISARGFTAGKTLHVHIVRGGSRRNIRLGRLRGACNQRATRARLFRPGRYRIGRYRVQFDGFRRFRRSRTQKVVFNVRIFRIFRRASASAAGLGGSDGPAFGSSWTRVE